MCAGKVKVLGKCDKTVGNGTATVGTYCVCVCVCVYIHIYMYSSNHHIYIYGGSSSLCHGENTEMGILV